MARKPKSKSKTKASKPASNSSAPETAPKSISRRTSLATLGLYGVGAAVFVGGGGAFARDVMRKLDEQDLTRIGQGTPSIVQIHDPNCGLCRALQRETRTALKDFAQGDVVYLVANITSTEGAAFSRRMGLGHVTLVLMDGTGAPIHTIQGVTPAGQLSDSFKRHLNLAPAT